MVPGRPTGDSTASRATGHALRSSHAPDRYPFAASLSFDPAETFTL